MPSRRAPHLLALLAPDGKGAVPGAPPSVCVLRAAEQRDRSLTTFP